MEGVHIATHVVELCGLFGLLLAFLFIRARHRDEVGRMAQAQSDESGRAKRALSHVEKRFDDRVAELQRDVDELTRTAHAADKGVAALEPRMEALEHRLDEIKERVDRCATRDDVARVAANVERLLNSLGVATSDTSK